MGSVSDLRPCDLSIVVPAFEEAPHLGSLIPVLVQTAASLTPSFEIIIVDDGSADSTWSLIEQAHAAHPAVAGLRLSRNFGKDAAVAAGLEHARGRAVVILDADLQHPPSFIPHLYRAWLDGAEVVNGLKRHRENEPPLRRLFSRLFQFAASRLTGLDFANSSDFKLLDRKVVDAWLSLRERRGFFRGMVAWLGFRSRDLYFDVNRRAAGASKWSAWALARLAWNAATSYSTLPLRIIHLFSASFLIISLVLGSRAMYQKLTGQAVDGFTTVIILELLIGGLILLSLAIIAEYLAAIYEESKARPRYLVTQSLPPAPSDPSPNPDAQ
jgi:glycosyltransferase involved in cell wall biosynthesis